ncbi:MAG: uracil phosphoribosyltransferase [Bacteroidia bacterium]
MVHILGNTNSVFNNFIAEIRDIHIQKDSMRFRKNMERMGEIFAYEISKHLSYITKEVTTPLGVSKENIINEQIVVGTILRAGLPLHQGVLNFFDNAQNAFIAAYRKHHKDGSFDIQVEYISSPDLNDKILILTDPMLATGASITLTYKQILQRGKPKHTHIVSVLASVEGLDYAKKHLPSNVTIWLGAVDDELTAQSYIVPGLGDAGDLAYGTKL